MVVFRNRQIGEVIELEPPSESLDVHLRSESHEKARDLAPGWDVYVLETEWRNWMHDGGLDAPKDADKAYLGFCRKWYEKRGQP